MGGDLVSIFSKAENEFIARKVLELNPDLNGTEYYYPWIGLSIRKGERKGKSRTYYKLCNLSSIILVYISREYI